MIRQSKRIISHSKGKRCFIPDSVPSFKRILSSMYPEPGYFLVLSNLKRKDANRLNKIGFKGKLHRGDDIIFSTDKNELLTGHFFKTEYRPL